MLSSIDLLHKNSKVLIICLYHDVFILHVVCIVITLPLFKLWSLLIGRIWVDNNWRINIGARNCGGEPRIKTKGGTEGQQNCFGMIFLAFLVDRELIFT
jgi:hypothetical protein